MAGRVTWPFDTEDYGDDDAETQTSSGVLVSKTKSTKETVHRSG